MKSPYEDLTPEIQKLNRQYEKLMLEYVEIDDNNPSRAFELAKEALFLSDEFITVQSQASKLASAKGEKSEIRDFFYQRYRTLQLAHEHLRAIWRVGEERIRMDLYNT